MWDPNKDVEGWFYHYTLVARTALTLKQQHEGIPDTDAIENSCSDVAEQYISDVLHDSNYEPHEALQMICTQVIPQKIVDKWKPEDMVSIVQLILYRESNIRILIIWRSN